jgi:hypothetical protein
MSTLQIIVVILYLLVSLTFFFIGMIGNEKRLFLYGVLWVVVILSLPLVLHLLHIDPFWPFERISFHR